MLKGKSFLEKVIMCKKFGFYLDIGIIDKVFQIKRFRGIKSY